MKRLRFHALKFTHFSSKVLTIVLKTVQRFQILLTIKNVLTPSKILQYLKLMTDLGTASDSYNGIGILCCHSRSSRTSIVGIHVSASLLTKILNRPMRMLTRA